MENLRRTQINDLLAPVSCTQNDEAEIEEFLQLIDDSSSSSDESDFEPKEQHKCENFIGTIMQFNENEFKSHMRLKRSTVEYLIARFSQTTPVPEYPNVGRPKITRQTKIYLYIWYISNSITYRQLGNLFGVIKSSAWSAVREVVAWLITIGHEYIKWPESASIMNISRKFEQKKGIAGVVGAIDCTHININAPKLNKECYFDRKQNYSLVLQAVVDADKRFIDIYCGEPGLFHDSRVLRRSDLFRKAETNYSTMFPNNSFIIGDSAYFSTNWLVPPFKGNGYLTNAQRAFNKIHSSTRMVVKNTFGLMKGRFRRLLKFTEHRDLCAVSNMIVSACILHNICVTKDDISEDEDQTNHLQQSNICVNHDLNEEYLRTNRREMLLDYLQEQNIIF